MGFLFRIIDGYFSRNFKKKQERIAAARELEERMRKEHWESHMPPTLLTVPPYLMDSIVSISSQSQSDFFTMLPLEIRQMVYTLALGGQALELHVVKNPADPFFKLGCTNVDVLMSFPKSCRLAYVEALEFVYSKNTFMTYDITGILLLPSLVAPQLLRKISSINLRWPHRHFLYQPDPPKIPPGNEATWESAWSIIASMEGLRHLRVDMNEGLPSSSRIEAKLLEPLLAVRSLEYFHVTASWELEPGAPEEYKNKVWPFKIQRRGELSTTPECPYPGCSGITSTGAD